MRTVFIIVFTAAKTLEVYFTRLKDHAGLGKITMRAQQLIYEK